MLSIQVAGTEILGDNPKSFYIFGGDEYGIKLKYIEHLKSYYNAYQEVPTVSEFMAIFNKKQLLPLSPKLYIVRYDDEFISNLSEKYAKQFMKLRIRGTLVCIYEASKAISKCNKYFPDNTISFDIINPTFVKQYLSEDFKQLSSGVISKIVKSHPDYMGAYNVCLGINTLTETEISGISEAEWVDVLGDTLSSSELQLRQAFASRNLYACLHLLEAYTSDKNQIYYTWMAAMLELEKLIVYPRQKSDLSQYVKLWDIQSVCNMFRHIYNELKTSRSSISYNIDDRLQYIALLLQYNPIPQEGVM